MYIEERLLRNAQTLHEEICSAYSAKVSDLEMALSTVANQLRSAVGLSHRNITMSDVNALDAIEEIIDKLSSDPSFKEAYTCSNVLDMIKQVISPYYYEKSYKDAIDNNSQSLVGVVIGAIQYMNEDLDGIKTDLENEEEDNIIIAEKKRKAEEELSKLKDKIAKQSEALAEVYYSLPDWCREYNSGVINDPLDFIASIKNATRFIKEDL